MEKVRAELGVSERRACAALGQHRSTQRKIIRTREDEAALSADIIALAKTYGRYGYRRVTALLRDAGWTVNAKRVERIWRREGLKVPQKQPKRGRLWLNDGSCVRLRAERPNHVWAYDFVEDRTHDGRKFRMLCVIDEFTREALAIRVKRRLNSTDVLETLADLMIMRGPPAARSNSTKRSCSARVLGTVRRRRRLSPGASISTSLRALAMSIATSIEPAVICSSLVMVGLSPGEACNTVTMEISGPAMAARQRRAALALKSSARPCLDCLTHRSRCATAPS